MGNKHSSSCKVKYLHAPLVSSNAGIKKLQNSLHAYEFATVIIRHSSYDELQAQVVAKCPYGYHCVIPIARRHHLMWSTHFLNEVDELTQPIFKEEYDNLDWDQIHSVCVQILSTAETKCINSSLLLFSI